MDYRERMAYSRSIRGIIEWNRAGIMNTRNFGFLGKRLGKIRYVKLMRDAEGNLGGIVVGWLSRVR